LQQQQQHNKKGAQKQTGSLGQKQKQLKPGIKRFKAVLKFQRLQYKKKKAQKRKRKRRACNLEII